MDVDVDEDVDVDVDKCEPPRERHKETGRGCRAAKSEESGPS